MNKHPRNVRGILEELEKGGWVKRVFGARGKRLGIILLRRVDPNLPAADTPARLSEAVTLVRGGRFRPPEGGDFIRLRGAKSPPEILPISEKDSDQKNSATMSFGHNVVASGRNGRDTGDSNSSPEADQEEQGETTAPELDPETKACRAKIERTLACLAEGASLLAARPKVVKGAVHRLAVLLTGVLFDEQSAAFWHGFGWRIVKDVDPREAAVTTLRALDTTLAGLQRGEVECPGAYFRRAYEGMRANLAHEEVEEEIRAAGAFRVPEYAPGVLDEESWETATPPPVPQKRRRPK